MAEAALCQVWGTTVPGREKQALTVYNEAMQWWTSLEQDGKIDRFDVALLNPSGGDVAGFLLARGTAAQIDSLRRSKEYQQQLLRVQLVASHFRVTDAYVEEGLALILAQAQEVIEQAV